VKPSIVCAVLFVSVLFVSLAVVTRPAKTESTSSYPVVTILSPTNGTYNSRNLNLNVTFVCGLGMRYTLKYSLDGRKPEISIPWTVDNPSELHVIYQAFGSVTVFALGGGLHSVTVNLVSEGFVTGPNPRSYSDTVWFTVDLTPPKISEVSVENKTYTTTDAPLNFTVNENTSGIMYSLDGNDNVTIAGNTTLTGLSTGPHNVTLYARDVAGNTGASQTVTFAVVNESETEPFPVVLVAVALAAMLAVGVGLTVHFKKRNHQQTLISTATTR
jgi:hypothetical protein